MIVVMYSDEITLLGLFITITNGHKKLIVARAIAAALQPMSMSGLTDEPALPIIGTNKAKLMEMRYMLKISGTIRESK